MMCQHLVFSQTRAHLCLGTGQSVHILSLKCYTMDWHRNMHKKIEVSFSATAKPTVSCHLEAERRISE